MRRNIFPLMLLLLVIPAYAVDAAADIFAKYDKIIWIDQANQVGAAYDRGKKLWEFPIMTGDDETPTPPGTYVINRKVIDYYSRSYDTPMPYSLFFDYRGRAIHEGGIPDPEEREEWATHGCIHVEQTYMARLYDWAEKGKTVVVIRGRRALPPESPYGEELEDKEEIGEIREKAVTE